jgi:hypothetical protein
VADKRSIHWKKWDDLTLPKCHGGMGFKDVKNFNLSMLGKQGWRLMMNPDSLCARVLKGKYFPHGNFMTAGKKKNSSHTWRAIIAGRKVLELGLIKRIGDGTSTIYGMIDGFLQVLAINLCVRKMVQRPLMLLN